MIQVLDKYTARASPNLVRPSAPGLRDTYLTVLTFVTFSPSLFLMASDYGKDLDRMQVSSLNSVKITQEFAKPFRA